MALELIASPVLELLFEKLSSLISKEFHLLQGINKDLEKLSKILFTIKDVLVDAEVKQITDKPTRVWLTNLKDATYDVEDLLDEFEYEALLQESHIGDMSCAKQVSDSLSACFDFKQIMFRRKMGKRIKELIEIFNEIDAERFKFQLTPGVVVTRVQELSRERETSSIMTEPIVCGRERETESIVKILLDNSSSSNDLSICPIVGIGGLGKTTLAQLVYNDEKVVNGFDTRIWICVSEDFGVKRISNMIINHLSEKKWDIEDLDPTVNQLKKLLNGRKYLLVLDDVWDDDREKWNKIIHLLACGGKGSSIIVTTRLQAVVTSVSLQITKSSRSWVINQTINLECLLEHDCQSLFKHYAFGTGGDGNQNFSQIGEEIVRKCGGLPLAIKAIGSLLNSKSEVFWRTIRDSEIWGLEEHGETTILPALQLSYNHLPPSFRQCFGYCSVYPKDYSLNKQSLIHGWMANGLIQSRGGMEVEDIGDEIFKGLCQRSFFQNIIEGDDTDDVQVEMHDLVHDLSCLVMKECSRMTIGKAADSPPRRVRYLSVECDSPNNHPNPLLIPPFLHTLIFLGGSVDLSKKTLFHPSFSRLKYLRMLDLGEMWSLNNLPPWIGCLKLLRYLNLENTGIASLPEFVCGLTNLQVLLLGENGRLEVLPSSIGKLKNLRHLDLSKTLIKLLPESICTLTNLQTLNLTFCWKLERLPRDMKKMKSLRNLIIMWEENREMLISGMPVGIGELTRLESLEVFVVSEASERFAGIHELGSLNQLKGKLSIEGIRHVRDPSDSQQAKLKNKDKLSELYLFWGSSEDVSEDEEENEEEMKMTNQVLESLEPHPNIQSLVIEEYPGVELPRWVENCAQTLPNLRKLELCDMSNVVHVLHQLPPNLVSLWIIDCPKLKLHPELRYPSSINELSVEAPNDPTLRSVEELPHLSKLQISGFSGKGTFLGARLRHLICLQVLRFADCSNVKRLLPKLENLQNTMKELQIIECGDLDCITEQGWRNLASLQTLKFDGCNGLTTLSDSPSSLGGLKSLTRLDLVDCPNLVWSVVDFQHLVALEHLHLEELPHLTSLPDGIQHVTTLQYLYIRECKNLRILLEWLLQQHLPPSLRYLLIKRCHPELHKRCEVDKGEEWRKISHLEVDNFE